MIETTGVASWAHRARVVVAALLAVGERRVISTSRPAGPSRSSRTVAAGRGTAGSR